MGGPAGVLGTSSGFVGRERELDELRGGLDDVLRGRGRLCLLTGDAGIGKSRLAEEIAALASERGARVLWGRCWHGSGATAYWPWIQILRTYVRGCSDDQLTTLAGPGAAHLGRLVPEIGERLDVDPAAGSRDPELARLELFEAVSAFLRAAAPLVLVLDDLHWADRSSLLLLSYLARDVADADMFVIGAYRDIEAGTDPDTRRLLAEAARHGAAVPLRGLDEADVAAFVERSFGVVLDRRSAEGIHTLTGGNPFFVSEVVRLLAAEGRLEDMPPTGPAVPAGVKETVRRRLELCAPATRDVLEVAATIGSSFSLAVLEGAAAADRPAILVALDEAISLRILSGGALDSYVFAHALIRETIYEDLSPGERAQLHGRVGEAIERLSTTGRRLPEIAHHFVKAALGGLDVPAITYSVRAGRRAVGLLAYEEAAKHFERALGIAEITGDSGEQCRIMVDYGDALWRAGDPRTRKVFAQAAEGARATGSAGLLAEAALGFGQGLGGLGFSYRVDRGLIRLLEDALEAIGPGEVALRVRLLSRLAVELYWSGEIDRRLALAEEAVTLAEDLADPALQLVALYSQQWARQGPDTLPARLEAADRIVGLAEQVGDHEMSYRGHAVRFTALLELGDVDGGHAAMEHCAALAEELRMPLYRWHIAALRAGETLMAARLEDAERLIEDAFELGRSLRSEAPAVMYAAQLGILRMLQGRFAEIELGLRASCDGYPWIPSWRAGLCWMAQESNPGWDPCRDLDRIGELAALPRDGGWLATIAALAVPYATIDDRRRASQLYDLLVPYGGRQMLLDGVSVNFGPVGTPLGVLATMLGRPDDAARHFEEALRTLERTGNLLFTAGTLREYAAALLETGDLHGARKHLDAAVDLMDRSGLEGLRPRALALDERLARLESQETVFHRDDGGWIMVWSGCTAQLRDAKGLGYLHQLLRSPGREVHTLDLMVSPSATSVARDPEVVAAPGDAGPVIDEAAKNAYRRRLTELDAEVEEATAWNDPVRAERGRREIDALTSELARGLGLGGRHRRAGSTAERARVNVTRAIRSAIARIAEVHPDAAAHLEASVRTGTYCSYHPDGSVRWSL